MKRFLTTSTLKNTFTTGLFTLLTFLTSSAQDGLPYRTKGALTAPLSMNWNTSGATGAWQANITPSGTATWVDATQPPNATNTVQIRSNHNVTVDIANAACSSIDFTGASVGSSLTIPVGNTLAVTGVVGLQQPTSNSNKVTVQGTLTAIEVSLKAIADPTKIAELVIDGGTVTLTNDVSAFGVTALGVSSKVTFTNGGILNLNKNFMSGAAPGTLTAGTGVINLTGTTIQNLGGYNYNNINVLGTGMPYFIGNTTISGTFNNTVNNIGVKIRNNLTVTGTFNAGTGTYTFDAATPPASYTISGTLDLTKITIAPQITVTNTGTLTNGGLFINDGTFVNNGSFTKSASTYRGSGTFSGATYTNSTIVLPDETAIIAGDTLTCMTFANGYDNGTGILDLDISGASACTQYEQINVSGTFNASGTLKLDFGSYTPSVGQTFTVVTGASSFTGSFTSINEIPSNITASYANGVVTILSTIPVELSNFDVKRQAKATFLTWTTQSERENAGFDVEHMVLGGDFKPIAHVMGNGTTNAAHNYTFEHNTPSVGVNYYRLKQMDYSGKVQYSPIRSIIHGQSRWEIKNTVAQNTLDLIGDADAILKIRIVSIVGQEMYRGKIQGSQSIDISRLPAGLYIVQSPEMEVGRFVKQ